MKICRNLIGVIIFAVYTQNTFSQDFYLGADLSYVNEMEDCGAIYTENSLAKDPYLIFKERQANIARYRLWHTPDWTDYSTFEDVKKSMERAKEAGFTILLDFHYSDTWADPNHQTRPFAWQAINDLNILADSLYNYTYHTLERLFQENLLPEIVQIGNETNGNILLNEGEPLFPVEWDRNIFLFERAISAVEQININYGVDIKTVIHIAQPENALWWFEDATANGLSSYDIIGISYYPGWSEMGIRETGAAINELKETYDKEVMIVETGYPWTLEWADDANNLLGIEDLLKYYGDNTSPEIQKDFLTELSWLVKENGGSGVIYWEPAWVSTDCYTQWGQGSHWENATFFYFDYDLHEGIGFLNYDYSVKPTALDSIPVTFKVDMSGVDTTNGVFVTGDFTGVAWQFMRMHHVGDNIFKYDGKIVGRSVGAYIFQNKDDWQISSRESVPAECALFWDTHREFIVGKVATEFAFVWGSCTKISEVGVEEIDEPMFIISPNPVQSYLHIQTSSTIKAIEIYDLSGSKIYETPGNGKTRESLNISSFPNGIYLFTVTTIDNRKIIEKIIKHAQ